MAYLSRSCLNLQKQIQCAEHIVTEHNIYISDYLRIEFFLYIYIYKTENYEKNNEQTSSKQKIVNVSSVNECHKRDTRSRARKTEHIRSRQNSATPFQNVVHTVKS